MKFGIITDNKGSIEQIDVDLTLSAEAKAHGAKHPLAYLDSKVMVNSDMPSPRQQIYAQLGLNRKDIKLKDAMDGTGGIKSGLTGPTIAESNSVTGRLAASSYLFDMLENSLRSNDYGILGIFNSKAAAVDSIANTKFDRPIINMSRPAEGRSRAISQLSMPARMLTLTVSDISMRISGSSLGLEYSDQAAESVSLPIVAMSLARQAEEEAMERVEGFLLGFLNGDVDMGMAALATVPGAVKKAKDLDATVVAAGTLSQKAWVNYLFEGSRYRQIDTIVTDLAGALAIEQRVGRPTVQSDDSTSKRIDVPYAIINPTWPNEVKVIVTQDPSWPANTIMGFDSKYGYHVVNSTTLGYEGLETFALRRSTALRFDQGSIAYRLYDSAFSVLSLSL